MPVGRLVGMVDDVERGHIRHPVSRKVRLVGSRSDPKRASVLSPCSLSVDHVHRYRSLTAESAVGTPSPSAKEADSSGSSERKRQFRDICRQRWRFRPATGQVILGSSS